MILTVLFFTRMVNHIDKTNYLLLFTVHKHHCNFVSAYIVCANLNRSPLLNNPIYIYSVALLLEQ